GDDRARAPLGQVRRARAAARARAPVGRAGGLRRDRRVPDERRERLSHRGHVRDRRRLRDLLSAQAVWRRLVLGALVLALAGCASSAQLLWEEYTNAGLSAARAGQYNRASMFLNRAAQKAEELGPQELGRSLNNLAELARRRGQTDEAERLFLR